MSGVLLDTNVVSEIMKTHSSPPVSAWLARYDPKDIFISAVSRAEIEYGIFRLPEGRKKRELAAIAAGLFEEYDERCLPFDKASSAHFAYAKYVRKKAGFDPKDADMFIAAVALQERLVLATRNVRDFGGIGGLEIVDPWGGAAVRRR